MKDKAQSNGFKQHSYRHCKDVQAILDLFAQNKNQKVLKIKYFSWFLLYVENQPLNTRSDCINPAEFTSLTY
jgi:hypothetical protein